MAGEEGTTRASVSSNQQEDSESAPLRELGQRHPLAIPFSQEDLRLLELEVSRLNHFSVCRIFGSCPNRQELKDLLYGRHQGEAGDRS